MSTSKGVKMVMVNIELYEALKGDISEKAAKMIAEVVPQASDLATKADIKDLEAKLLRFTLAFFMPLWIAMLGTLLALLVRT
jgi:hypothetical protein